jgi:hypothetical protein
MENVASTGPRGGMCDDATTRAIAWLTTWDSQGIHRTATAGDAAGADWLIREAAGIGAAPAVEKFVLDRLDPIDTYLELDNTRLPGVPVFDAPAARVDGVASSGRSARSRISTHSFFKRGIFEGRKLRFVWLEGPHYHLRYFCAPHHEGTALHPVITHLEHAAGFARDDSPAAKLEKLRQLFGQGRLGRPPAQGWRARSPGTTAVGGASRDGPTRPRTAAGASWSNRYPKGACAR